MRAVSALNEGASTSPIAATAAASSESLFGGRDSSDGETTGTSSEGDRYGSEKGTEEFFTRRWQSSIRVRPLDEASFPLPTIAISIKF